MKSNDITQLQGQVLDSLQPLSSEH